MKVPAAAGSPDGGTKCSLRRMGTKYAEASMSRRAVLGRTVQILGLASLATLVSGESERPQIRINHAGFAPQASKHCVVADGASGDLVVVGPANRVVLRA